MDRFPGLRAAVLFLVALAPILAAQNRPPSDRVSPPTADLTAQELEDQGDTLRGQKDYLGAIDCYRAAWKKAETPILHNKAGISYSQLHRVRDAKREYEHAIHLDPSYAEPHNNLGALYYGVQHFGPSVKEYQKAIRLSPDNAVFHNNLGAAYFSQKDFNRAMKEFTRAVELDPTIFERQASGGSSVKLVSSDQRGHFHYLMAQMYGSQNNVERCRYYLAKANEEGYPIRDALHDGEFAGLRKDPEFVSFVRSLKPPGQENQ